MARKEERKSLGRMDAILLRPFKFVCIRNVGRVHISISVYMTLCVYVCRCLCLYVYVCACVCLREYIVGVSI